MTEAQYKIVQQYLAELGTQLGLVSDGLADFVNQNAPSVWAYLEYEGCEKSLDSLYSRSQEIQSWLAKSEEEIDALLAQKPLSAKETGNAFERNLLKNEKVKWLFYVAVFLLVARMLGKAVVTFSVIFLAIYFFFVYTNKKEYGTATA